MLGIKNFCTYSNDVCSYKALQTSIDLFIINHLLPKWGNVGSGLRDRLTETISDKWMVEALKEYL